MTVGERINHIARLVIMPKKKAEVIPSNLEDRTRGVRLEECTLCGQSIERVDDEVSRSDDARPTLNAGGLD